MQHLLICSQCVKKAVKPKKIMTVWNSVTFEEGRRYAHTHNHTVTHIMWDLLSWNIISPWWSRQETYKMRMSLCHFNSHYWPAARESERRRLTWHLSSMSASLLDLPQLRSSYFLDSLSLALLSLSSQHCSHFPCLVCIYYLYQCLLMSVQTVL